MMNYSSRYKAEAILDEVFELLDEIHLYKTIDEPIDRAAASFQFKSKAPVTHNRFIEITSRFIRYVYQRCLLRQQLTDLQARCETMALLEESYQSSYARGYHAAYLDAIEDLEHVLAELSSIVKMVSRAKYIRWACTTRIDPSNWATKCRIVEALISRSSNLPPSIANCSPPQLTDHIHQLIKAIISSECKVDNLLTADSEVIPH